MTLINTFKQEADAMADQLVAWRRDFHMHPELGPLRRCARPASWRNTCKTWAWK
ncbi:MAG: hypothetical protein R2854_07800 [Caldilineaceae bacterium]